jgi:hypothetical protein
MKRLIFLLSCVFLSVLSSCTEQYLQYPGNVRICPDRSVYALPALEYRFYGTDAPLVRKSDSEGNFEGKLPRGVYRVLAANTGAGDVTFSDMESYDRAAVSIDGTEPATDGADAASFLPSLDVPVYGVRVEELDVPVNGSVLREPSPALLTRRLVFDFTLSDGLDTEVGSISGQLPGVYSSVYLSTGLPTSESVSRSARTYIRFEVSGQGEKRSAETGLLGLRNPKTPAGEKIYDSTLALSFTMTDGSEEEIFIDLSGVLSDIIAGNGDVFPQRVSVFIELKRSSAGIGASIKAWGVGDEKTVIVGGGVRRTEEVFTQSTARTEEASTNSPEGSSYIHI